MQYTPYCPRSWHGLGCRVRFQFPYCDKNNRNMTGLIGDFAPYWLTALILKRFDLASEWKEFPRTIPSATAFDLGRMAQYQSQCIEWCWIVENIVDIHHSFQRSYHGFCPVRFPPKNKTLHSCSTVFKRSPWRIQPQHFPKRAET